MEACQGDAPETLGHWGANRIEQQILFERESPNQHVLDNEGTYFETRGS
ncbi:hypothetical protein AB0O07_20350 [Streptomyces sp. NPDC093085]